MKANPLHFVSTILNFVLFCALFCIFTLYAPLSEARGFYVATNGNDNNDGSALKPFASIQAALNLAGPGDTVFVRGGTYRLKQTVDLTTIGTATRRLVLRSYPNERATLDGSLINGANPQYPHVIAIFGAHIDVMDLDIVNSRSVGISAWRSANIRLINNTVSKTQGTGIGVYESSNVQVLGNKVSRSNLSNQRRVADGGWGMGISSFDSKNVSISNNTSFENYGEGIGCVLSVQCTVSQNKVYDNFSVEIYFDNTTNSRMSRNLIYNTGNPQFFRRLTSNSPWYPASGIQMANEIYGKRNPLNNNLVDNNIVIKGGYGFYYGNYLNGGGLKNTRILNNTFYAGTLGLLFIDKDAGHLCSLLANNIFYQTGGKPISNAPTTPGLKYANNLWFGSAPGANVTSSTDVYDNPLWAATGGINPANYKLRPTSPAINEGANFAITLDFFGKPRKVGLFSDIGAHEYP